MQKNPRVKRCTPLQEKRNPMSEQGKETEWVEVANAWETVTKELSTLGNNILANFREAYKETKDDTGDATAKAARGNDAKPPPPESSEHTITSITGTHGTPDTEHEISAAAAPKASQSPPEANLTAQAQLATGTQETGTSPTPKIPPLPASSTQAPVPSPSSSPPTPPTPPTPMEEVTSTIERSLSAAKTTITDVSDDIRENGRMKALSGSIEQAIKLTLTLIANFLLGLSDKLGKDPDPTKDDNTTSTEKETPPEISTQPTPTPDQATTPPPPFNSTNSPTTHHTPLDSDPTTPRPNLIFFPSTQTNNATDTQEEP